MENKDIMLDRRPNHLWDILTLLFLLTLLAPPGTRVATSVEGIREVVADACSICRRVEIP